MTLNSSVIVQGVTVKLRPFFERVNEDVSGGKPHAGNGVDSLLSWHGLHLSWYNTVTKPNYYY